MVAWNSVDGESGLKEGEVIPKHQMLELSITLGFNLIEYSWLIGDYCVDEVFMELVSFRGQLECIEYLV